MLCLIRVQRYTDLPVNPDSLLINILLGYTFGCTGCFPMCHQASFHLKFAIKYPLLALKLPEIWVVFKTGSGKKRGKKDAVVYFLTYTDTFLFLFSKCW